MESVKDKNFGLRESEFHEMKTQLKQGDETIFEKIYLVHFKLCKLYLKSTLKASEDESHDATMQTLLNFRRSLVLDKIKYGNLNFLFTQMAYYEVLKKRNKAIVDNDRNIEYYRSAVVDVPKEELKEHRELVRIISSLPEKQKKLIVSHYYNDMKLKEIALQQGVSSATIRKRKERILKSIKSRMLEKIKSK